MGQFEKNNNYAPKCSTDAINRVEEFIEQPCTTQDQVRVLKRTVNLKTPIDFHLKHEHLSSAFYKYPCGSFRKRNRRWRCKPIEAKQPPAKCLPTLHGPVGVQLSVFTLETFFQTYCEDKPIHVCFQTSHPFQALATCYAAFGYGYTTPEAEWTEILMNEIFAYGQVIFRESLQSLESLESPKEQLRRQFVICNNSMRIELSEPIIIGMLRSKSCRTYSLPMGLDMFMQKYDHCICEVLDLFFLIWRREDAYFLFDCYGRNTACFRDTKNGFGALICVYSVKNIGLILQQMSNLDEAAAFSLYAIEIEALLKCCDISQPRTCEYQFVSEDHAILEGTLHLAHQQLRSTLRKQALAIALVGIIYSKIDPSCTWDSSVLDKVLAKGNQLHQCLTQQNAEVSLVLHDFPANIQLGQFTVSIEAIPQFVEATRSTLDSCNCNLNLTRIGKLFVENNFKNLIIQAGTRVYGAWRRKDFYYILDPYPRTITDAPLKGPEKRSALHMINSVEMFCATLNELVASTPMPSPCNVHVLKVLRIRRMNIKSLPANKRRMSCVSPMVERSLSSMRNEFFKMDCEDDDNVDRDEAESLNESVQDIECRQSGRAELEVYDIDHNELDSPVYSNLQLNRSEAALPLRKFFLQMPLEGTVIESDEWLFGPERISENSESCDESEDEIGNKTGVNSANNSIDKSEDNSWDESGTNSRDEDLEKIVEKSRNISGDKDGDKILHQIRDKNERKIENRNWDTKLDKIKDSNLDKSRNKSEKINSKESEEKSRNISGDKDGDKILHQIRDKNERKIENRNWDTKLDKIKDSNLDKSRNKSEKKNSKESEEKSRNISGDKDGDKILHQIRDKNEKKIENINEDTKWDKIKDSDLDKSRNKSEKINSKESEEKSRNISGDKDGDKILHQIRDKNERKIENRNWDTKLDKIKDSNLDKSRNKSEKINSKESEEKSRNISGDKDGDKILHQIRDKNEKKIENINEDTKWDKIKDSDLDKSRNKSEKINSKESEEKSRNISGDKDGDKILHQIRDKNERKIENRNWDTKLDKIKDSNLDKSRNKSEKKNSKESEEKSRNISGDKDGDKILHQIRDKNEKKIENINEDTKWDKIKDSNLDKSRNKSEKKNTKESEDGREDKSGRERWSKRENKNWDKIRNKIREEPRNKTREIIGDKNGDERGDNAEKTIRREGNTKGRQQKPSMLGSTANEMAATYDNRLGHSSYFLFNLLALQSQSGKVNIDDASEIQNEAKEGKEAKVSFKEKDKDTSGSFKDEDHYLRKTKDRTGKWKGAIGGADDAGGQKWDRHGGKLKSNKTSKRKYKKQQMNRSSLSMGNETEVSAYSSSGSESTSQSGSISLVRSMPGQLPNPSAYPGYRATPCNMAVIASENGSYKNLCSLIASGFQVADRILAMTPWGNYVLFKHESLYYLFDGCTCNTERFRYIDISSGTAGLTNVPTMHDLILALLRGKMDAVAQKQSNKFSIDNICREFCK